MNVIEGEKSRKRRILEEIADAFRQDFPQLFADQVQLIEDANKALIKPTAMSVDGHFMLVCKFVPEIYVFVQRHLGHDFWQDPENIELVRQVWPQCSIKRERKEYFKGV